MPEYGNAELGQPSGSALHQSESIGCELPLKPCSPVDRRSLVLLELPLECIPEPAPPASIGLWAGTVAARASRQSSAARNQQGQAGLELLGQHAPG